MHTWKINGMLFIFSDMEIQGVEGSFVTLDEMDVSIEVVVSTDTVQSPLGDGMEQPCSSGNDVEHVVSSAMVQPLSGDIIACIYGWPSWYTGHRIEILLFLCLAMQ